MLLGLIEALVLFDCLECLCCLKDSLTMVRGGAVRCGVCEASARQVRREVRGPIQGAIRDCFRDAYLVQLQNLVGGVRLPCQQLVVLDVLDPADPDWVRRVLDVGLEERNTTTSTQGCEISGMNYEAGREEVGGFRRKKPAPGQ